MTVVTSTQGYLEGPYLEGPYLTTLAQGAMGWQANFTILSDKKCGMQAHISIIDYRKNSGQQARIVQTDRLKASGQQARIVQTDRLKASGQQAFIHQIDRLKNSGQQATVSQVNRLKNSGMQTSIAQVDRLKAGGQQTDVGIFAQPAVAIQANVIIQGTMSPKGQQATIVINAEKEFGMQAMIQILDHLENSGMQSHLQIVDHLKSTGFEVRVDKYPTSVCADDEGYLEGDYLLEPYLTEIWCTKPGMQAAMYILDFKKTVGMQAKVRIADKLKTLAQQAHFHIVDKQSARGMQIDVVRQAAFGMQTLATIYNTTNLRILCDFPSRGLTNTNWTSNSTAAGDFSVQNLDTDIVEQVWRSDGAVVGVRLMTDTGLPQGVFLDTLAILNHNLTKSATVNLLGSNDPTFATIGVVIPLQPRLGSMFYIAPILPNTGWRYWRFDLDDPTNSDGYLEIGTIIFGAADIFQGECFVDEIEFELKDFADTVRTEGFTNVANSRTQKRRLRLDFRSLSFQKRNFTIMRDMFERDRTVHKCLWIPTPDETRQDVTARFAVFGKMATVPTEKHNNKGAEFDYVTFTADVDESL